MRRLALLVLPLSLAGCTGFGTFLDHVTRLPGSNPDLPQADSENIRQSLGERAPVGPLLPQSGDVWPAAPAAIPTLGEVARHPNEVAPGFAPTTVPGRPPGLPAQHQPVPTGPPAHPPPAGKKRGAKKQGSSTPPGSAQRQVLPLPNLPAVPPVRHPAARGSAPPGGAVPLPNGTGIDTGGTSSYRQLTLPNGQPGAIIVPNGNGTSTVIGPDGSVTTVPTPNK